MKIPITKISLFLIPLCLLFASIPFVLAKGSINLDDDSVESSVKIENPKYVFDTSIDNTTLGVGSIIALPHAKIVNMVDESEPHVKSVLTIKKNNVIYSSFDKVSDYNDSFTFEEDGAYEFIFSQKGCDETPSVSYSIVIKKDAPKIDMSERIPYSMLKGEELQLTYVAFEYDDKELETDIYMYDPSGRGYIYNDLSLDDIGTYKIEFRTALNNTLYTYTKEINVYGTYFNYEGSMTPYYGESILSNNFEIINNYKADNKKIGDISGINVILEKNKTLYYEKLIDLSKLSSNENLIEFYVEPTGDSNVNFIVELVDENDPNNVMSVRFSSYKENPTNIYRTWLAATATGLNEYVGRYLIGNTDILYVDRPSGGSYLGHDISLTMEDRIQFYNPLYFAYDEVENLVYNTVMKTVCADFDDTDTKFEKVYNMNGLVGSREGYFNKTWDGFSSSKVYVRMYAEGSFSKLGLTISKLGKEDLSPSYKSLFNESYFTNKAYFETGSYVFYGNTKPEYGNATYSVTKETIRTILEGKNGLNLEFNGTDSFEWNSLIDLSKYSFTSEDDIVNNKIISFYGYANGSTLSTNTKIYVDLIDENDPNNFITILFNRTPGDSSTMIYVYGRANNANQKFAGINGPTEFNTNNYGQVHVERFTSTSGAKTTTIIDESRDGVEIHYRELSFCYDESTKRIYTFNVTTPWLVCDLDDNVTKCNILAEGKTAQTTMFENAWSGFSSSKVYLRIRTEGNQSGSVNLLITKIGDTDLSSIPECTRQIVNDSFKFENNIDEFNLVDGVVERTYRIPVLTCKDVTNNYNKVSINVYQPNGAELNIINGAVTPIATGEHKIVYTIRDTLGFELKKELKFNVLDISSYNQPVVILPNSFDPVKTGVEFDLPTYELKDGSFEYSLKVNVYNDEKLIDTFDGLNKNKYKFTENGEYRLEYIVTDSLEVSSTNNIIITSYPTEDPIVLNDVSIPNILFSGWSYNLPSVYMMDYKTEPKKKIDASIKIVYENGTSSNVNGNTITPTYTEDTTIKIVYYVKTETGYSEVSYDRELRIANVGDSINIISYFISENSRFELKDNGISYVPENINNKIEFAKPILLDSKGISFNFVIPKECNKFNKVNIYLTDSVDESIVIKLTVVKPILEDETNREDNAYYQTDLIINDGKKTYKINGSFYNQRRTVDLSYSSNINAIQSSNGMTIVLEKTLYGEAFNGFTSNFINIRYEIDEIEDINSVELILTKIGNQNLDRNSVAEDWKEPLICVDGDYKNTANLNEEVSISKAISDDVLSQTKEIKVTVTDSNGNIVKDINGVDIKDLSADVEYKFIASLYGTYSIKYTTQDFYQNKNEFTYMVIVSDITPPTITINDEIPSIVKLVEGKYVLKVPNVSAIDDDGSNAIVTINIKDTLSIMHEITSESIVLTSAGKYEIYISAYDKSGNYTLVKKTIIVQGV